MEKKLIKLTNNEKFAKMKNPTILVNNLDLEELEHTLKDYLMIHKNYSTGEVNYFYSGIPILKSRLIHRGSMFVIDSPISGLEKEIAPEYSPISYDLAKEIRLNASRGKMYHSPDEVERMAKYGTPILTK